MNFNKRAIESVVLAAAVAVCMAVAHPNLLVETEDDVAVLSALAESEISANTTGVAGVAAELSGFVATEEVQDASVASIEDVATTAVAAAEDPEAEAIAAVQAEAEAIAAAEEAAAQAAAQAAEEAAALAAAEAAAVPEEWQNRLMVRTNVDKYLNVRAEASTDSSVVGKLYRGSVATIVEQGEEWTKITSGSVEGYVNNEYVAFGKEAQAIAEEEGSWIVTSTAGGLRVREEPSTESRILSALSEGQELHWDVDAETVDGWVAVIYKNGTGYVSAEYVTVELDLGVAISIEEEQAAIAAANAAKANKAATLSQGAAVAANYDDVTLLAALIWCEGGNQGDAGRLAIGAVVVNRIWSSAYPNTLVGVIYQSGQFGPASNGTLARCLANGSYSQACVAAAEQALSGVTNVGGALHFQSARTGRNGTVIGAHVFY